VFFQDLVKPFIKEEADQVVKKPPDQAMESSLTAPAVPPTTNADD
jgi:hypothetical protein